MIQVGGLDAFKIDYEVPLKYGVDQCIGDSLGAGGIFRQGNRMKTHSIMELCFQDF
jgi:alpha-galactosidase/6-phospho-beta-glucosidase family protein